MSNSDRPPTHLAVNLTLTSESSGQVLCQRIVQQDQDQPGDPQTFAGQSQNHAIAIALEHLAEQYRKAAEDEQAGDWDAVERSPNGDIIQQRYHVILHYERIAEDESKFEAMHNTIMGNTVVENATIAVIKVDEALPLEPIVRPWNL
jgi:hypothetical protein